MLLCVSHFFQAWNASEPDQRWLKGLDKRMRQVVGEDQQTVQVGGLRECLLSDRLSVVDGYSRLS